MANRFFSHPRMRALRPPRVGPGEPRVSDADSETGDATLSFKSYTMHRFQVGLSGLAGVVLLIALADTILSRADQSEASAVPEAAATVQGKASPVPQNDPLAEAGVVPASPTPSENATPAPARVLPTGRPDNAPQ